MVRVSEGRRFISDRCPRAVDLEALKRLKNRVVREVMRIDDLSNEQLLSALCRVLGDERRAVAAMLGSAAPASPEWPLALNDERTPREIVRFVLVRLGFRERDVGTALARLPATVWSEPLDVAVCTALRLLT
ncbi:MAG: hypothetical protein KIT84_16270 [Labilithrix sp.]|nr:hypothetical protein [Labilithrix sp.]MCW5812585.1 hypothetical protein [Labilithrix sp.]